MKPYRTKTAGLLLSLALAAGCGGGDEADPASTPTSAAPTSAPAPDPSGTPPAAGTPSGSAPPSRPGSLLPAGYLPLWPFTDLADSRSLRPDQRRWNLDAGATALEFTRAYLGFTGIDRVTSRSVGATEARIGVGYRSEEGGDHTAAVVHLFRAAGEPDGPWEVVGTDDTTLSLTVPSYGARASAPLTVGGRITGVDESLQARLLHPGSGRPLGEYCCLPAGGRNTAWRLTLPYRGEIEEVATVVVWTGGHVADVERFAVTGVRP